MQLPKIVAWIEAFNAHLHFWGVHLIELNQKG